MIPCKYLPEFRRSSIPRRGRPGDAAADMYSAETKFLWPFVPRKFKTGVAVALPAGHVGKIEDRSGLGSQGIKVLGGVIDPNYRGDQMVCLINLCFWRIPKIRIGDRIAQLLVYKVNTDDYEAVADLDETERGSDGFGSSGR